MFSAAAFSGLPLATSVGNIYEAVTGGVAVAAAGLDSVRSDVLFSSLISELVNGADQAEGRLLLSNSVVDGTAVSEDEMSATTTYTRGVAENVVIQRLERYIGLGFATGGFASGSFAGLGDGTSFYGGDIFSANIEVSYAFEEGAQLIDQAFIGLNVPAAFLDGAAIADNIGAIPEYPGEITEAGAGSITISAIPEYPGDINESSTASVTGSTLVELGSVISEVLVGTDIPTTLFVVNSAVSEVATQIDRPFTQYITRPVFVDMAQASDISEARLQWENINTFETADWVLIDTNK